MKIYNMTKQQQLDHQTWKENPDQPLPASLKNVFIEDCLKELKKWDVLEKYDTLDLFPTRDFYFLPGDCCLFNSDFTFYHKAKKDTKIVLIQTLLSRTPDGKAVMEFLDVKVENKWADRREVAKQLGHNQVYNILTDAVEESYKTLDHLLYREFTEALRTGKTFDEAYKIINLIYLQNV